MPKAIEQLKNKEWLVSEYVDGHRAAEDIANEVGCDKSAVCRALKKHGIEVRKRTSKYATLSDEAWLRQKYVTEGLSLNEIAELTGSTAGNVHAHLISKGIETRDGKEALGVKYPDGRFGEAAARWAGGKRETGKGYIYLYRPDHPYATKAGYVMEHRLVMEEYLGTYLGPEEDVHHINEDVRDNRLENLVVLCRSDHKIVHSVLKRLREAKKESSELETILTKYREGHKKFVEEISEQSNE